jgi:hypothetical protein
MTAKQLGILACVGAFSFYAIMFNLSDHGWLAWYRMSQHGIKTTATVTEVRPQIHQGCSFEYEANGKQYRGTGGGCSQVGVNGKLEVYYLPDDPLFVTNREPIQELLFEMFGSLFLSMIAGMMVAWRQGRKAH